MVGRESKGGNKMNAPTLMKVCQKLAPMLKLTPREVWPMMDLELSILLDKPYIKLDKLDEFLLPYDEDKFTMAEIITERYGKENCEYIENLI